jgi:L-lactate dehydrogenase complex protein LldG
VTSSREVILTRVRAARDLPVAAAPIPRAYRHRGDRARAARIDLLCERIGDYRAEVRRVPRAALRSAIATAFAARNAARVCVPAGVPQEWRSDAIDFVEDAKLTAADLDRLDGVLTGCTLAIAETGTIVLGAGPTEGRRALTLVPDLHVCVVEAMAALAELVRTERRPLTFISGPSATSDIELNRVEGVHGPRTLVVLVAAQELP